VGADVVALDNVAGPARELDLHAITGVAADDVARGWGRAADQVAGRNYDRDPVAAVARRRRAVWQEADEIALDDVPRAADEDAVAGEPGQGEAADRGPARALERQAGHVASR